jgi:hypothetical protein
VWELWRHQRIRLAERCSIKRIESVHGDVRLDMEGHLWLLWSLEQLAAVGVKLPVHFPRGSMGCCHSKQRADGPTETVVPEPPRGKTGDIVSPASVTLVVSAPTPTPVHGVFLCS